MSELSWLGEKEELQCAIRGDVRSIKRIVTKLAKPGFHLAYKTLLNVEDAEDCVQESFYQLWRSNNQFQAKSSLKTYFFRFVFNSSFLILKKRKETIWHDLENYNEILNLNINSTIFDESFDRIMSSIDVEKALSMLVPSQRTAIILWAYFDYSSQEIAEIMGSNKNAVDQLLFRSKQHLKHYFGENDK